MTRIPVYTPRIGVPTIDVPRFQTPQLAGQVSDSASYLGDALRQKQEDDARVWAAKKVAEGRNRWSERLLGFASDGDPTDATARMKSEISAWSRQTLSEADSISPYARRFVEAALLDLEGDFVERTMQWEASAGMTRRRRDVDDVVTAAAASVARDPGQYRQTSDALAGFVNAVATFSPDEKSTLKRGAQRRVAQAAVDGLLANNPQAAKEDLDRGAFDDALTPAEKARAQRIAEAKAARASQFYAREAESFLVRSAQGETIDDAERRRFSGDEVRRRLGAEAGDRFTQSLGAIQTVQEAYVWAQEATDQQIEERIRDVFISEGGAAADLMRQAVAPLVAMRNEDAAGAALMTVDGRVAFDAYASTLGGDVPLASRTAASLVAYAQGGQPPVAPTAPTAEGLLAYASRPLLDGPVTRSAETGTIGMAVRGDPVVPPARPYRSYVSPPLQEMIDVLVEKQIEFGVTGEKISALPRELVAQWSTDLAALDSKAQVAYLRRLRGDAGRYWGLIVSTLAPHPAIPRAAFGAAAIADEASAALLSEHLGASPDVLIQLVGKPFVSKVNEAIDETGSSFFSEPSAFTLYIEAEADRRGLDDRVPAIRDSIVRLAVAYRTRDMSLSADDAAARAMAEILGPEGLREINGHGVSLPYADADAMAEGAEAFIDAFDGTIDGAAVDIPGSDGGTPSPDQYARAVRYNGYLVRDIFDDSYVLFDGQSIVRSGGRPVRFTPARLRELGDAYRERVREAEAMGRFFIGPV